MDMAGRKENGAGSGNRTRTKSLEGSCDTISPCPRSRQSHTPSQAWVQALQTSIQIVTGPSLTSDTCMSAPKRPVWATTPRSSSERTNRS